MVQKIQCNQPQDISQSCGRQGFTIYTYKQSSTDTLYCGRRDTKTYNYLQIDLATFNTKMAVLRLANELIILIASNVRKPSHVLHLALVNKRIHGIAIKHLYENVTFHQDDYLPPSPSSQDEATVNAPLVSAACINPWLQVPQIPPSDVHELLQTNIDIYSNILRLSDMIGSNTLPAGHPVTRLTIVIDVENVCSELLFSLLQQLSSLKDYTLVYVSKNTPTPKRIRIPFAPLAATLSHTSQTLQSLSMHFAPDRADFGGTIGSLHDFSELQDLSIQADFLIGSHDDRVLDISALSYILPPRLKRLQLHECNIYHIEHLRTLLDGFVLHDWKALSKTETKYIVLQWDVETTDQTHPSTGGFLQGSIPAPSIDEAFSPQRSVARLIQENGPRALDLEMALEWRSDYHPGQNSPLEETLATLLHECTQKLDEVVL